VTLTQVEFVAVSREEIFLFEKCLGIRHNKLCTHLSEV
jgi:hypothetical protein